MTSLSSAELVQTERLICERLRVSHAPQVSEVLRDPRVSQWLWPPGQSPSEQDVLEATAQKERHWERYGFGLWLVRDRADGRPVGWGGLQWSNASDVNEIEAAWAIVSDRWGEGLATELAEAAIDVAFGPLELLEIVALTRKDNAASRRVMEKTGFVFDRELIRHDLPHVVYRRRAPGNG